MVRLSKMTGKVYAVRDIYLDDSDEIEDIMSLIEQGTPVLLVDDDMVDDEEAMDEFNIDVEEIIFADE